MYYDGYDWDLDGFPGEYVYGSDCYIPDEYMDERWKSVNDQPGYYISNRGRIYSSISESFIEGTPNIRSGHIDLSLKSNGKRVHKYTHRMVAEAFIPNPKKLPIVRHLDDCPNNNYFENLAWGTQQDNINDMRSLGHDYVFTERDRQKAHTIRSTPIVATNVETGEAIHFESQQEASRKLSIDQACISDIVRGTRCRKTSNGYTFKYEEDYDD